MQHRTLATLAAAATLSLGSATSAAETDHGFDCDRIHFGQPNWTGVSIKTDTATWMLEQIGYETKTTKGSLPIVYQTMTDREIDALLAQWMPSQREQYREFGIEGSLDIISPNLVGGRYTIAVPDYVYEAGVKSIEDLDKHKEKFGGEIYGIEPGSGGNDTVKKMIADDYAGLGDWDLVASSEPGMLSEVANRGRDEEWIAFLGWAPHPMNINHDMEYLAGGEDYWGPNKGEVIVNTVTPTGFAWACSNAGQFLDNYDWTVEEQSLAMGYVNNDGMEPLEAGKKVIRENPQMIERWFGRSGIYQTGGVRSADGENNAEATISEALGL
ncbi:MAG: ABC transporter substrate-binding protein [Halofilum sp. (in: g-proteobacteria)]